MLLQIPLYYDESRGAAVWPNPYLCSVNNLNQNQTKEIKSIKIFAVGRRILQNYILCGVVRALMLAIKLTARVIAKCMTDQSNFTYKIDFTRVLRCKQCEYF